MPDRLTALTTASYSSMTGARAKSPRVTVVGALRAVGTTMLDFAWRLTDPEAALHIRSGWDYYLNRRGDGDGGRPGLATIRFDGC